ncbi:type 4a pilus biogenesis protein PilO [Leifsonia sp. 1010]|uniref:type 4a pilus biogenesis protein PilO n=1 Tax=Leifsonia sp. 1010 TaxID=2817769 RepID=UPI002866E287|nr:type 4a pilus biogenesis protein PilO [Leifsonia sp. 1010]MDR6610625.1 Tfp pilus assembly protein PilO [Leifsonia sp. 1010]
MDKNRIWIIGSVLVAVAIVVGGWFLAIAPQLGVAAQATLQRAQVDQQNAQYTAQLRSLQAAHAKLPQTEQQLAELAKAIPADAGLPAFYEELNSVAASAGVTVTKVTPSDAVPYIAPTAPAAQPAAAAPSGSPTPAPTPTPTPTATPTPAPSPTAVPGMPPVQDARVTAENLSLIPLVVTVSGPSNSIQAFVKGMQSGDRLFLVTGVSISASTSGPAYEGRLSGYLFALAKAETVPTEGK